MTAPQRRAGRFRLRLPAAIALLAALLATALTPARPARAATTTDSFDGAPIGSLPAGWSASSAGGSVGVADVPGNGDRSLALVDSSASAKVTATRSFPASGGEVIVRYRVSQAQTSATSGLSLRDAAGTTALTVGFDSAGQIYSYDGAAKVTMRSYSASAEVNLKIVARPYADSFDVYVEDQKLADDWAFRSPVSSLAALFLNSSDATTGAEYYDYISVTTPELAISYPQIGTVAPRPASQISASNWSIGAETLDRDFATYEAYKSYLGALGAKQVRLQAGWAKSEPATRPASCTEFDQSRYCWQWLDAIVNDVVAQGMEPWLETSYGNPKYGAGGGEAGLGGDLPTSAEALAAWDAWVTRLVDRYKDRVDAWEVWNEPNINSKITATEYAAFYIRTAEIIRARQPGAKIYALALAGISTSYTRTFLQELANAGKLGLVDAITYHGYTLNPDSQYSSVAALRDTVDDFSSTIRVRQGENGAPSTEGPFGALKEYEWTELSQAKWDLRRMLGDLGRDIPSNVFTIIDLEYPGSAWNYKGLLRANDDQTVAYPKAAYRAVQSVTAIFDSSLSRISSYAYTENTSAALAVFAYQKSGTGRQVVTIWQSGATPSDSVTPVPVTFTFSQGSFSDPVYVDLRTGAVYDIPSSAWSVSGSTYTFTNVPIYDSPILIAERAIVLP